MSLCDDYLSDSQCNLRKSEPGSVLSPFVEVTFKHVGTTVTVGNLSNPSNKNNAVIRDFEFGHSDGAQCRITIHDQAGSDFVQFMKNLLKDSAFASPDGGYTMDIRFGWVKSGCEGAGESPNISPRYHLMCDTITCNFTGGKFMYEIGGCDIGDKMFEAKADKTYGTEKDPIHITEAITKLFTEDPPKVGKVSFKQFNQSNQPEDLKFKVAPEGDPKKGPKGYWESKTRDKLNCALDWLKSYVSENGKAIRPTYNSLDPGGEIIFWEDYSADCGSTRNYDQNCLGTYIINGGGDSPVIEFNPKIKWDFYSTSMTSGGTLGTNKVAQNPDGSKQKGDPDCKDLTREHQPTAGPTMTTAISQNATDNGMTEQQVADAQSKQLKTMSLFFQPIEAELVIQGDPQMTRPQEAIWNKNVMIVFLNPYHLFASGECGDWLQEPACNPWLTNKAWTVKNVTHRINDGKYITSLSLYLVGPGVSIDSSDPVGGAGSGGPSAT